MRAPTPAIYCDAEDGECSSWDLDYYDACVSTVNGTRITQRERAPGWKCDDADDYCPEHAPMYRVRWEA